MKGKGNKYLTREEFLYFLEEDRRKWEENQKKWEENQKKWEENQKKIEEHLAEDRKKWEENQRRWEENQRKWEENQKRFEEYERKWEENQKVIRGMLSQLSRHGDLLGFGIEGLASALLPYYLENRHNIIIKELKKNVFSINGKQVEINLFGLGRIGRKKVAVLVECKSTIGKKSIRDFVRKISLAEPYFRSQGMEVMKMVFGPLILSDAARIARSEGIEMVSPVPQAV